MRFGPSLGMCHEAEEESGEMDRSEAKAIAMESVSFSLRPPQPKQATG